MAACIAWLTYVVDAVNSVVQPSEKVWLPALPHAASCEGQQQASRDQCRSFHFPSLPYKLIVTLALVHISPLNSTSPIRLCKRRSDIFPN